MTDHQRPDGAGGSLRILALEPFLGGSHKAFLDGWRAHSRHDFTILGYPDYKWKWRMRHSALGFAEKIRNDKMRGSGWDVIFCSDMLDLAQFKGLAPRVANLPAVCYFHENQLTYPVRDERERDLHFAFTNMTSALAADEVWFNSEFHRASFLEGLDKFLSRMPDNSPVMVPGKIKQKSRVVPQGIYPMPQRGERRAGPIRILWAARWEHD
ncbi:MAG: DUF3524 domain-containing protein, partial [Planctomycetes bacterium]|nr:DUF3524 domain-containing protein [Planctomycetota bacterium]